MSTLIAIDPGYDRCGVAIINTESPGTLLYSSCISTTKTDLQEVRMAEIYEGLKALIEEWRPAHMALETLFFSVNKKSAMKVAEARGIAVLLAGLHTLSLIELSPQEVKLAMTGSGNADKAAVIKMVGLTLKIDTASKLDDEVDAIALGFAALSIIRQNTLKGIAKKKSF